MSIKSIIKKLINNNILSEAELALMEEKEIRSVYKLHKEEIIMNKNTTEVIDNATVEEVEVKEESIMRTTQELLNDALTITKIQDEKYVTNEMLRNEYNKITGKVIGSKKTRPVIIKALQDAIAEDIHEEVPAAEETVVPEAEVVSVGDLSITYDNTPESIEGKVEIELTDKLAAKILEAMIRQANTNIAHNFISHHMLTSIISEIIVGLPLKEKKDGVTIEHWKTFTDEQKEDITKIREAFIQKTKLIAKPNKDNTNTSGYFIPSKILVWGRHKYLNFACVYRYVHNNKLLAEYHVSLNGIKNIATGKITPLDDAAYEILDTRCSFVM